MNSGSQSQLLLLTFALSLDQNILHRFRHGVIFSERTGTTSAAATTSGPDALTQSASSTDRTVVDPSVQLTGMS